MYKEFFGLTMKPFSITPDPRFLYLSPGHKEALAHLLYGIKEASGFVVITGEVGTGKTTILNAFLLKLPPRMPKVVIKNPHVQPENLYFLLGEAIGIPEEQRRRENVHGYEERLKATGGVVLIVDESQGLSIEMLEEIRLLSNLETTNEKLVQIMLLGQQELNEKLKSPQLRQLKQRIGLKYHIPPLDSKETGDYIDHRLRVAGYEPKEKPIFTASALGEIYRYSKGFPRLINIVCDNVLLSAYTENISQISASMVRKVVFDLESTYGKSASKPSALLRGSGGSRPRIWLKVALAFGLCLVLAAAGWTLYSFGTRTPAVTAPVEKVLHAPVDAKEQPLAREAETPREPAAPPVGVKPADKPAGEKIIMQDESALKDDPPIPPSIGGLQEPGGTLVVVKEGDTVAELATDYYGRVDIGILRAIKEANPSLDDMNLIYEGQQVFMPDIKTSAKVLYSVSVASYHSVTEARAVFLDLLGKSYDATIYPSMDAQGNTRYRITIGTFAAKADAIGYSAQLKEKGFFYAKPVKISMEE